MLPITTTLLDRFRATSKQSIVCIGDVILDKYLYGDVTRISPEAPVPILNVVSERRVLGGAGNVAANIAALGAPVDFISLVGNDAAGTTIASLCANLPNCRPILIPDEARLTSVKTRCVAGTQQMLRVDKEIADESNIHVASLLISAAKERLQNGGVLVLSDYNKGVLSPFVTESIITHARDIGCQVLVDPKARDYAKYRNATILTPNLKELIDVTAYPLQTDDDIISASKTLISKFNLDYLLATRSAAGMTLVSKAGTVHHIPTIAQEVFDVSGAGDTVLATLAVAFASGIPPYESAVLANQAAGVVVGKLGTATLTPNELIDSVREYDIHQTERKIIAADQLIQRLAHLTLTGNFSIGFTNGCFDLLHPGHVKMIEQCRTHCDFLVIGVNTDESVTRLKGPDRPIQNELSRSIVLASLQAVDAVVLFSEDTPIDLIHKIRPDIIFKGGDYTPDQVVGGDFVASTGGRVMIIDFFGNHSTTGIVQKLDTRH